MPDEVPVVALSAPVRIAVIVLVAPASGSVSLLSKPLAASTVSVASSLTAPVSFTPTGASLTAAISTLSVVSGTSVEPDSPSLTLTVIVAASSPLSFDAPVNCMLEAVSM